VDRRRHDVRSPPLGRRLSAPRLGRGVFRFTPSATRPSGYYVFEVIAGDGPHRALSGGVGRRPPRILDIRPEKPAAGGAHQAERGGGRQGTVVSKTARTSSMGGLTCAWSLHVDDSVTRIGHRLDQPEPEPGAVIAPLGPGPEGGLPRSDTIPDSTRTGRTGPSSFRPRSAWPAFGSPPTPETATSRTGTTTSR
jgi:hypothetical protein